MSDDTMNPTQEPNYRVIELVAENEHLKDKLIAELEDKVSRLELEIKVLRSLITGDKVNDSGQGAAMIAPVEPAKPRVRTMSEVASMLEAKSGQPRITVEEKNKKELPTELGVLNEET